MQLQGTLKLINETKAYGTNDFRKREIVLTTQDGQYSQDILIELHQDKCDAINNYNVGDDVIIDINIRGREWISPTGDVKYFNSIVGWKIESAMVGNDNF